jgi:hypothetical protein
LYEYLIEQAVNGFGFGGFAVSGFGENGGTECAAVFSLSSF